MLPLIDTVGSAADVLAEYLTTTLELFTKPTVGDTWPLFTGNLPDHNNVEDSAAAVYDVSGAYQGKNMNGEEHQRYCVLLYVRAASYRVAWTKLSATIKTLIVLSNRYATVDERVYTILNISRESGIVTESVDSKQRNILSIKLLASLK